jgi:hypothetical protein
MAPPTNTNSSVKKYIIPAKRRESKEQVVISDSIEDRSAAMASLYPEVQVLQIGTMKLQIVPQQEVKPTFRTPCKYMTVG